jgi:hypothetical protein
MSRRLITVLAAFAAVLALGGGALALAGDDRSERRAALAPHHGAKMRGHHRHMAAKLRLLAKELAPELGKSEAEVRTAMRGIRPLAFMRARTPHRLRDVFAAELGRRLSIPAADVTAAIRRLVAKRVDKLQADGWITQKLRDAVLACYDDETKCEALEGIRKTVMLG